MPSLPVRCIVFDFGRTLSSGPYFGPLGWEGIARVSALVFGDNSPRWADPWMRGELSSRDVARYLAEHTPYAVEELLDALRRGCSDMAFNPAVWDLAVQQRGLGRKLALVTANMDVFTEVVVPAHRLDETFDAIVNSADYGTLDKVELWQRAFDIIGEGCSFEDSLLIEDSLANVDLFRALGGRAYRYTDDASLLAWLSGADL
jgi:FMN phosphatase YigB (HAD superfamily)